MPEHILNYSLTVPSPRPVVFAFFTDIANMARITPPELDFAILPPVPVELGEGTVIKYRLKLYGISFETKIQVTAWSPFDFFIDEQLEGPYRQWIHRHTFRDGPDGSTTVEDEIRFRLPTFPLGEAAYPMAKQQMDRIFSYGQQTIKSILATPQVP